MAENKKSFILYCDLISTVAKLTPTQAGKLFKSILEYVNNEKTFIKDDFLMNLFNEITSGIELEWLKYNPLTKKYHWNYKGGITPENKSIRNCFLMKLWRYDVFTRDNYTCVECKKKGGVLNAHHIKEFAKYPELRFDINNGLTLCKSCHTKIHSNG